MHKQSSAELRDLSANEVQNLSQISQHPIKQFLSFYQKHSNFILFLCSDDFTLTSVTKIDFNFEVRSQQDIPLG